MLLVDKAARIVLTVLVGGLEVVPDGQQELVKVGQDHVSEADGIARQDHVALLHIIRVFQCRAKVILLDFRDPVVEFRRDCLGGEERHDGSQYVAEAGRDPAHELFLRPVQFRSKVKFWSAAPERSVPHVYVAALTTATSKWNSSSTVCNATAHALTAT